VGLNRQILMFAPVQNKCVMCDQQFIPFSKHMVRLWDQDLQFREDWLSDRHWAIDRIYHENLQTCCPACYFALIVKRKAQDIQDHWERLNRKYR